MGKQQQSSRNSKSKYHHVSSHNPKARESEERRIGKMHQLSVKRLRNLIDAQKEVLRNYYAEGKRKVATKIDPNYQLKGAARVARESYPDPNFKEADLPEDILTSMHGRLHDHKEGQVLLQHMMDTGVYLHNKMERTADAVKVFEEMLQLDKQDRMCARHSLLRCHLDNADAVAARGVISKYASIDGNSVAFRCTAVFIEILSLQLKEKGSSAQVVRETIAEMHRCNPFILWILTFSHLFEEVDEVVDALISSNVTFAQDGLEEALRYYRLDLPLWTEDETTLDLLADFIKDSSPPLLPDRIDEVTGRVLEATSATTGGGSSSSAAAAAASSDDSSSEDESDKEEEDAEGESDSEEEEEGGAASAAAAAGDEMEGAAEVEAEPLSEEQIDEVVATCRSMYNTAVRIIRRELKSFHNAS